MEEEDKKICFVMMPISDTDGYEKGHFNRVYEHLIKPAVIEAGFEPIRADDTSKANFIVVDILQQILACDMAICDLSSRNPNVFYELGIRQAFNLKTVLIKDNKTIMPFDIAGIRTLPYNENLRIDDVKKTIPEMTKCIKSTFEAESKDVNSLLQLLSIEKPASLPDKVTLSQDSSVLLNEINKLHKRIDILAANVNNAVQLPNGETAQVGDMLYDDKANKIGVLVGEDSMFIIVRDSNNEIQKILKRGDIGRFLSRIPF